MNKIMKKEENMNYIRRILQENCISQNGFARILGIEKDHLSKLMNGKQRPYRRTVKFLAEGLERLDGLSWRIHARYINEELNGDRSLKIVGEE